MFLISSILVACFLRPDEPQIKFDSWFLKDKNQQSCASCHSVDGIELRSFSDADILRRTARHHSGDVVEKIHALVLSHPKQDGEVGIELRPMQPGGRVLPGITSKERDEAFLVNLRAMYPRLFVPISNSSEALAFQTAILDVNLNDLPVGIAMNHLSEDGAHGVEHKSIANWIPDVPTFDSDLIRPQLENYQANPTVDELAKVDKKLLSIAKANDAFAILSLAKYRALLVYQHELRTKSPCSYLPIGNPFWQVAEFSRVYADSDIESVKVPPEIASAKGMPAKFKEQLKQLRLPWFWLGWTRDPSITQSGLARDTLRGDYFCKALESDGPYIGHEAFMLTRKLAEQGGHPAFPNAPYEIQYTFFLTNTPLIEREPKEPVAQKLFRIFTANSFRMNLYLLESDIIKSGKTYRPVPQANQISYMGKYLNAIGDHSSGLINRVLRRLTGANGSGA